MRIRKELILILPLVFALLILSSCQEQGETLSITDNAEVQESGYIYNFNTADMNFDFDAIEWITLDDTDRIKELNLDPDNDMPSGFYVTNPVLDTKSYKITDQTEYQIMDWSNNGEASTVNLNDFALHLNEYTDYSPAFWIVVDKDVVISITEQYTP